jgi:hypothetical protein
MNNRRCVGGAFCFTSSCGTDVFQTLGKLFPNGKLRASQRDTKETLQFHMSMDLKRVPASMEEFHKLVHGNEDICLETSRCMGIYAFSEIAGMFSRVPVSNYETLFQNGSSQIFACGVYHTVSIKTF